MTTFLEAPPAKGTEPFSHKYGLTRDGRVVPAHEVVGKNGKVRSCTIREIRNCSPEKPVVAVHGDLQAEVIRIVPSVTTIMGIMDKPGLSKWKNQQLVSAVLANPKQDGESDEAYVERVVELAGTVTRQAAELGSRIHKAIENFGAEDPEADIATYVHAAQEQLLKLDVTIVHREYAFLAEDYGFGGTSDLVCVRGELPGIVDFKSRTKLVSYETDALQLSSYGNAIHGARFYEYGWAANIVISTAEPGEAKTFMYDTSELRKAFEVFKAMHRVWKYVNGVEV